MRSIPPKNHTIPYNLTIGKLGMMISRYNRLRSFSPKEWAYWLPGPRWLFIAGSHDAILLSCCWVC